DQSRVGASFLLWEAGTGMASKPAYMHLVYDGPGRRLFQRRVSFPIVRMSVHHYALHCGRAIVSRLRCCDASIPFRHNNGPAIGIDQDLRSVKAKSPLRVERTLHTITVDLARLKIGDEDMPVVIGPVLPRVENDDASRFRIIDVIE